MSASVPPPLPDRLPPDLSLELTARCNFACPYCYNVWHEVPALARPELSTDGWKQVLARCADAHVRSLLLTGGEPLLRPDFLEILDTARALLPDARLSLFTNASRLTDPLLLRLRDARVHIATSLQGLRAYSDLTGTRRSCRRLLSLLARAAELRCPLAVSITLTRRNLPELPDLLLAAALSGAASIQLGPMMLEGRARLHPDLMLTPDEWRQARRTAATLPGLSIPISFCDEFYCACHPQPSSVPDRWGPPPSTSCPAGRLFGVIGPTGRYRTCLHTLPCPLQKGDRLSTR